VDLQDPAALVTLQDDLRDAIAFDRMRPGRPPRTDVSCEHLEGTLGRSIHHHRDADGRDRASVLALALAGIRD
jgi:hypothetical protein